MRNARLLFIIILAIFILSQPIISSLFIANEFIVYLLATLGYLLILFPAYRLFKIWNEEQKEELDSNKKRLKLISEELSKIYEATKNDFFFYEHRRGMPFCKVSQSISDLLECDVDYFKLHYSRFKASSLVDGAFKRVSHYAETGIRVPVYEVELQTENEQSIQFEVTEIPILDSNLKVEKIWGIAHNISQHYKEPSTNVCSYKERFDILYNSTNDAVFIMQGDRFVDCNSQVLEMFETSLDQVLMYSPFSTKFSPTHQHNGQPSKTEALKKIQTAYEGDIINFEWTHLKHNGTPFDVKVRLSRFESEGEVFLIAVIKDLSFERQSQKIIQEKEQFINLLYYQSNKALINFDQDFRVKSYNEATTKLLKVEEDGLIGQTLDNYFDDQNIKAYLNQSKTGKKQSGKITLNIDANKTSIEAYINIIPLSHFQKFSGGILSIEELMDIKTLQKQLISRQTYLDEIISNGEDVIYRYNLEDKAYDYISNSIEAFFGYTKEEFQALSEDQLKALLHPKELKRADQILAKLLKTEIQTNSTVECAIIDRNGQTKFIRDVYNTIFDEDGKAIAIVGTIKDQTKLKEIEFSLKQNEHHFSLLTKQLNKGLSILKDQKIIYVNEILQKITEHPIEDLLKLESLFILATHEEKEKLKDAYLKVVENTDEFNALSFWIKTPFGSYKYIKNTCFKDPDNSDYKYVLTEDATHSLIDEYKQTKSDIIKKTLDFYNIQY
ncbi:MAG: PAS domain-containing protein [Bacteroidales bacterium]|nr:PAS domain-containing protein [Bacteroidales bacterium]